MPSSKIFKKPEINPIIRDSEIIRPELKGTSPEETFKADFVVTPKPQVPVEGVQPVRFLDAFQKWANEKLDLVINKATVVEAEAIAVQNAIVAQIDRKLDGAPSQIIEAINSIVESPTPITEELTECQLSCVAIASGMYGQQEDEDLNAKVGDIYNNSANDISAFQNEVNDIGPKVTGLWLFFFMVRFIVAFCVHVTLGFLCCYLRNKLIFKVGPFRVKFGEKIARPLGALEATLKDLLGFPCGTTEAKCLEPGKTPTEDQFRMFPCCNPEGDPGWDSCGTQSGDAKLSLPTLGTCFNNIIRRVADEASGDLSSPDGSKPCQIGECEPDDWNQRERESAKMVMQWLMAKSQAIKNSLTEAERAIQQPQMQSDIDFYYSEHATRAIDTSRSSRTIATGFKSAFNDNYEYTGTYTLNGRGQKCGLDIENAGNFANLNSFGNMTQDDIKQALKNNVDTSFVNELRAAEAEGTNLEFDGSQPPMEPFKTLYDTVNMLDDTLGGVLDELRKVLVSGKMLSNLLTDKAFCCVVYAIVVLGNLIRYQKLCPEKDLAELFDYAQDFGNNKDVQGLLRFLRLLQKLIDAINADLLGSIEGVGLGLPLGTMLELIKKAIASSVVALLAIALAPIDNALTGLANNPRLKALMDDNCFGIGDLFGLLNCGIKWIYDLIKKWLMELIPFKARNIELIANFRITGFRMKFFTKLSDILKMLIDLLVGIGDCFPPEKIPPAIMDKLADQPVGAPPVTLPIPVVPPVAGKGIATYRAISFEEVGNQVVDNTIPEAPVEIFPDTRQQVIAEMRQEFQAPKPGLGFPIYSEAIKIGFVDLIALRNGLTLPPAVPADEVDFSNLAPGEPFTVDPSKNREQALINTLNMVQNLKNFK